jgi:hypothetical protein
MPRTAVLTIVSVTLVFAAVAWTWLKDRVWEDAKLATPDEFISLLFEEPTGRQPAMEKIARTWQPGYAVMALETLPFSRDASVTRFLISTLEENTGERFGQDIRRWYEWIWSRPAQDHPRYAEFKSRLYRQIDPKFGAYFAPDRPANIRLDEVRWGGVRQDGIPPLRSPEMISAAEAKYLDDDNVVFGLDVNGDVRAYPKRILAWHELFTDKIGGVPVAGVYCTLCGTVILYETELDGVQYELGTSGFLYRSNKLMYASSCTIGQRNPYGTRSGVGQPSGRWRRSRSSSNGAVWSLRPGASGGGATRRPGYSPSTLGTVATTPRALPTGSTSPPTI